MPHNDINALAATVRTSITSAGNGVSGKASKRLGVTERAPTVDTVIALPGPSAISTQNRSTLACASAGEATRAVRHHRWVR